MNAEDHIAQALTATPGRYRKKPVVIEAWQAKFYLDFLDIAAWINANGGKAVATQRPSGPAFLEIHTLEGVMRADIFDWVIRGVQGEFYPCKPDIFEQTYEEES
jgi:hypothetical protein